MTDRSEPGPDDGDVERLRGNPPGYDEADPYEDVDLSTYPDWWRDAVEEFRDHDLRPYRPARFADETPVHEVVDRLKADLDVDVRFVRFPEDDEWSVLVDGETVTTVDRYRSADGYSVLDINADAFARRVREAVGGRAE